MPLTIITQNIANFKVGVIINTDHAHRSMEEIIRYIEEHADAELMEVEDG